MPPYNWIHIESVFWVLLGGLGVALAIILARGSRSMSFTLKGRSDEDMEKDTHAFAGHVEEQNRPVPVFIWLMLIGYILWAVGYVIYIGKAGL